MTEEKSGLGTFLLGAGITGLVTLEQEKLHQKEVGQLRQQLSDCCRVLGQALAKNQARDQENARLREENAKLRQENLEKDFQLIMKNLEIEFLKSKQKDS